MLVVLLALTASFTSTAHAQSTPDNAALLNRLDQLEKEITEIKAQLAAQQKPAAAPQSDFTQTAATLQKAVADLQSQQTQLQTQQTQLATKHGYFEKTGKDLTFKTPNGQFTIYGNIDVSLDDATKGLGGKLDGNGNPPVGNMGWLLDLSTNMSYIGVRGFQKLGEHKFNFIYQFETQIDIASQSGISESNSNQSNVVKGGLTSRNTFVGFSSPAYGNIMFGKTDTPYKTATIRMNPFVAMLGDYHVIMGNTGGDNRVEFATRLDHSIWFTTPAKYPFQANILFSPGQNRASNSDNIAAGESDCTGGNIPGSGGSIPYACNDGAFSNAVSASVSYTHGPIYVTAAYERHNKVNRSSDLTGQYANVPDGYMAADTADEDAGKVGMQFTFPNKATVSGMYETLHRYVPEILAFQNERQRPGFWFSATEPLNKTNTFSIGWAHAARTPGDPGQHNTGNALPPFGQPGDATGGPGVDNSSNLYTAVLRHTLAEGLTIYFNYAGTFNGPYAHYDLGAGGRAVTIDCHDASDSTGDQTSNPHCWAGGHLQGVSLGINRKF
jgi:predicted porin